MNREHKAQNWIERAAEEIVDLVDAAGYVDTTENIEHIIQKHSVVEINKLREALVHCRHFALNVLEEEDEPNILTVIREALSEDVQ